MVNALPAPIRPHWLFSPWRVVRVTSPWLAACSLNIFQTLCRQQQLRTIDLSVLIVECAQRIKLQGITCQHLALGVADIAAGIEGGKRRLRFYRASLVVEATSVKLEVAVATQITAGIVEYSADPPALRTIVECYQTSVLVGQCS